MTHRPLQWSAVRTSLVALAAVAMATPLAAQIRVSPTGVNLASQGATTVFLTFGGVTNDYVAAEAIWCGELIDARPDLGARCDPGTVFGRLPLRFDQSRTSGTNAFTDIMTVPASVTRRAYQAAASGKAADFFYVRRFENRRGGPDVYVSVICRLTGGGASSPLSLTDVRLAFDVQAPVVAIDQRGDAPGFGADITYTGTGRLQGRWEVVLPGEELPDESDLVTEASLPLELRASQRRYTQVGRFNVFLPPTGRARIPGPDPQRLPRNVDGVHLILMRVEASNDRDSQSDLDDLGAATGPVSSGAVAGFPLPTLRYVVGTGSEVEVTPSSRRLTLLAPTSDGVLAPSGFAWEPDALATRYRLEVVKSDGTPVWEAVISGVVAAYRPPPFLGERAGEARVRWRVRGEDATGRETSRSEWRTLSLPPP